MVKRPAGGAEAELALRELARRTPDPNGKLEWALERPASAAADVRRFIERAVASMPESWKPADQARALWKLIIEQIDQLDGSGRDPHWRPCLRAAFGIPEDIYRSGDGWQNDSLKARHEHARRNGAFGDPGTVNEERVRKWWVRAVHELGHGVERKLARLSVAPEGWFAYLGDLDEFDEARDSVSPDIEPVHLDRVVATYRMTGRAVTEAVTERWVTATQDGVEEYLVRAYSPNSGPDLVRVDGLLDCQVGALGFRPDGQGGEIHEVSMRFPEPLPTGGRHFFATRVTSQENTQPIVEVEVTGRGISPGGLTLRIQFDEGQHPAAAWWFGETLESMRLRRPPEGDARYLTWSTLGYLEYTFPNACRSLRTYGIAWEWPSGEVH